MLIKFMQNGKFTEQLFEITAANVDVEDAVREYFLPLNFMTGLLDYLSEYPKEAIIWNSKKN